MNTIALSKYDQGDCLLSFLIGHNAGNQIEQKPKIQSHNFKYSFMVFI